MKKKKKRNKKLITGIICGAVVVSLAAGVVIFQKNSSVSQASKTSRRTYQVNEVTKDEITVDVSGSGTLSPILNETFTSSYSGTVQTVNKSVGDTVKSGEVIATIYSEELQNQIDKLQDQLDSLNQQIANTSKTASSKYITAGISGQVKNIKAKAGSIVEEVQDENGYLCVISTDGKMLVTFTTSKSVKKYEDVTVTIGSASVDGTVTKVSGKSVTVQIEDNSYTVGTSATVKNEDGKALGKGKLALSEYTEVTAKGGVIDSVLKEENATVYSSTSLFKLTDYPVSQTYENLKDEKEQLEEELKTLKKNQTISVDYSGRITDLKIAAGDTVSKDDTLCVVQGKKGYELTVNVDELDISDLKTGSEAKITVEALDGTFDGKVTYISNVGNTENNVTTYEVIIQADEIDGALSGMSASATITAESSGETLTVPVDAVQTQNGESYVWMAPDDSKKGDELEEDTNTDELQKVTVKTGMSDGSFISVTGDLLEGDLIIVPVLTTTQDGSDSEQSGKDMMKGGMMGGQMPAGGGRNGETGSPGGGMPPSGSSGSGSQSGGSGGAPSGSDN